MNQMVYLHVTKEQQVIVSLIPFTVEIIRVYMPVQRAANSLLQWYRTRMIHPIYWRGQLREDLKEAGYIVPEVELNAVLALACEEQEVWNPFHPQHLKTRVRAIPYRKE